MSEPLIVLNMDLEAYSSLKNGRITLIGPIDCWDEVMMSELDLAVDWGLTEIELLISSPGGDVPAGVRAIRAIQRAQKSGVKVTGTVRGEAASMAFLVLQACDHRRMAQGDILMAHGITSAMIGDFKTIDSQQKLLKYWRDYFTDMMAAKVESTVGSGLGTTPGYWESIFKDETPVYYTPDEALEMGLINSLET